MEIASGIDGDSKRLTQYLQRQIVRHDHGSRAEIDMSLIDFSMMRSRSGGEL